MFTTVKDSVYDDVRARCTFAMLLLSVTVIMVARLLLVV